MDTYGSTRFSGPGNIMYFFMDDFVSLTNFPNLPEAGTGLVDFIQVTTPAAPVSRPHRRCWIARPGPCWWCSSRLVATAAEDCLSLGAIHTPSFPASSIEIRALIRANWSPLDSRGATRLACAARYLYSMLLRPEYLLPKAGRVLFAREPLWRALIGRAKSQREISRRNLPTSPDPSRCGKSCDRNRVGTTPKR
jgi:hypothetical protein